MSKLSAAIREAYTNSEQQEMTPFDVIEITHPAHKESLFFVNNNEGILVTLETGRDVFCSPVGFSLTLPESAANGRQDIAISIDNVDKRVLNFILETEGHLKEIKLLYRPYLPADLTTPQFNPPLELSVTSCSITDTVVSLRASFADILNHKFPKEYYTRERFSSLRY